MPELPEVETTRRGIAPFVEGKRFARVVVRDRRLRWPVPASLDRRLRGARVERVERRGKYLLLRTRAGTVLLHLGMSGSLRVVPSAVPPRAHDHVDLVLEGGMSVRLHDPRRFGAVLFTRADPACHALLCRLGPEPLGPELTGAYFHARARGRRTSLRNFLLDGGTVAGVGNIYANEAAFRAGIHPGCAAGRIARARFDVLARSLRAVLRAALRAGGTTLRDFAGADGAPGYFRTRLDVYGRAGERCRRCEGTVRRGRGGGRSLYFCDSCQW
ncbi:MAG: bifunctional DNA-formamidopyrimidine glycosylase/DNA-(apurinic or apyrimidinic site) lyase [Planctomycetes bacterium]|nr:bifunctional DNA-formamidopyrimidine glycosylase/DNA-(apurinic or apyrimidinic site) lyase [Planctomycetota bacterium]